MSEFRLIETMRASPDGEVYLLDRHLERLSRSARFFTFKCDPTKVRAEILQAIPSGGNPVCLRLTLSRNGELSLEPGPLPAGYAKCVKLSTVRVDSSDVFLYHKTTNRGVYDEARRECDDQTDAILVNERGEITETTIMNIAVLRQGLWITPHASCGLLPGVMRAEFLERGEVVEGVILANDLRHAEPIRCFNSLRGVCDVEFSIA